jgi:metal-sulfur cluster biosynthetic enzyme
MATFTKEQALEIVKDVKHPSIDNTLLNLGILKDLTVSNDNFVTLTLALPFPEIPILDMLINSLAQPLMEAGAEIGVETVVMTDEEKQRFFELEKAGWKGL